MANLKIAVDAGHGFNTAGKRSAPFVKSITHIHNGKKVTVKKGECFREHVANAGVAYYLAAELESFGISVFRSCFNGFDGTKDCVDPSIKARQQAIRNAKCDYSVSCHFNAYGDAKCFNTGQGIETLYHLDKAKVGQGKELAMAIQNRIKGVYGQKNRGIVGGKAWGMCNSVGMNVKAAVIMEYAFMTNQKEAESYFCNPQAWFNYAYATARGIIDYVTDGVPKIVDKNSDKKAVMWLQMMLNRVCNASLVVDGVYGAKTASAVKSFWTMKNWKIAKTSSGYSIGNGTIKSLLAMSA